MRIRNPPAHTLAQRQGIIGMDAVGYDHKLFTAKPICKIGHPRSRHDIEHDALEHLVPGSIAEAIVICLEMIDIDQQQGQWPPSGGGMLDSAAAVGFQRMTVESAGERVATGTRKRNRRHFRNPAPDENFGSRTGQHM